MGTAGRKWLPNGNDKGGAWTWQQEGLDRRFPNGALAIQQKCAAVIPRSGKGPQKLFKRAFLIA